MLLELLLPLERVELLLLELRVLLELLLERVLLDLLLPLLRVELLLLPERVLVLLPLLGE